MLLCLLPFLRPLLLLLLLPGPTRLTQVRVSEKFLLRAKWNMDVQLPDLQG